MSEETRCCPDCHVPLELYFPEGAGGCNTCGKRFEWKVGGGEVQLPQSLDDIPPAVTGQTELPPGTTPQDLGLNAEPVQHIDPAHMRDALKAESDRRLRRMNEEDHLRQTPLMDAVWAAAKCHTHIGAINLCNALVKRGREIEQKLRAAELEVVKLKARVYPEIVDAHEMELHRVRVENALMHGVLVTYIALHESGDLYADYDRASALLGLAKVAARNVPAHEVLGDKRRLDCLETSMPPLDIHNGMTHPGGCWMLRIPSGFVQTGTVRGAIDWLIEQIAAKEDASGQGG